MEKQLYTIPNISCVHCVATIQKDLHSLKGVVHVDGSPDTKIITVEWSPPATESQIEARLVTIGYPAYT